MSTDLQSVAFDRSAIFPIERILGKKELKVNDFIDCENKVVNNLV